MTVSKGAGDMRTAIIAGTRPGTRQAQDPGYRPILWPWVLVVSAWSILIVAAATGRAYLLEHHTWLARTGIPIWVPLLVFFGSWGVMVAAMMLPASVPALAEVARASRGRPSAW